MFIFIVYKKSDSSCLKVQQLQFIPSAGNNWDAAAVAIAFFFAHGSLNEVERIQRAYQPVVNL